MSAPIRALACLGAVDVRHHGGTAQQIMRRYRNVGGAQRLHLIGEDQAEMLDYVPAQLRIRVIRRPRYGCRSCEEAIVQAAGAGASH